MLIVFTGMRGSGKTTVARALCQELDMGKIRYIHHGHLQQQGAFRRILSSLYLWCFFDLRFFRIYLPRSLKKGLPSIYALKAPLVLAYNLQKLAKREVDIVVYDTDILTWPLDPGFNQKNLREFWATSVLPKATRVLIVAVDTNPGQALSRWKQRDGQRPSQSEEASILAGRALRDEVRTMAIQTVGELPSVTVLHVDGIKKPKENARQIIDTLRDQSALSRDV